MNNKNKVLTGTARALIRYVDYRHRSKLPILLLSWSTAVLCDSAKVAYAKRVAAGKPPSLPAFDALCPAESKQLLSE